MNPLPRWRGFNLLDMYIYEPGREKINPGDSTPIGGNTFGGGEGDFREEEFEWVRDWGFDFLRIPMDYRYWTEFSGDSGGGWKFRENVMQRIDRVVSLAEKYSVHVSLSFHRAPGYCVNAPAEARSLWTDAGMQGMFAAQWNAFAVRYRGVPSSRLSFDLVNEPPAAGMTGFVTGSGMTRGAHERVIRAAVGAIHSADPHRLIMANGLNYGTEPIEELTDVPNLGQSCRMYAPFGISHYQAHWVSYAWRKAPAWPGADHFGRTWGQEHLERHFEPWAELVKRGIGVHCGEGGAFSKTPHDVVLRWMSDAFAILRSHNIGWALWNLRGGFGILDSERADVAYAEWHGHRLDRAMLELLRAN
ncbi:MAG TPA: cellulase family glycosylhydrolase [Phycisphaerae bacterium]|nr:cellulase family glycosylhydrolase [Phycisphaerae bacterium]